jgi:thiamine transport system permease protein
MSKSVAVLVVIALVFGAFFFFPLTGFALRAFRSIGSQEQFFSGAFVPGLLNTLQFSSLQAFLSASLSVLIAIPGAFALSRYKFPLRRFIQSLSLVSFVLPSIVVIICMISFYGKSGVLNSVLGTDVKLIYSFAGIIVAHLFYNYALALRIIGDGWSRIGDEYRNISWSLGSGKFLTGVRVTLPLLLPSILSAKE